MEPQYYGFTGYMASRYATKESETRHWPLSGSLGDTLNHHKTATENQSTTGGYLDLTAVIYTANRLFKQIVEEQLVQSGFPPNGINVVPIPYIDSSQPFAASCTSDTTGGGSSVITAVRSRYPPVVLWFSVTVLWWFSVFPKLLKRGQYLVSDSFLAYRDPRYPVKP